LAGHRQPLRAWGFCLYFIELNLSNRQIAEELSLTESEVSGDDYALAPQPGGQDAGSRSTGRCRDRWGPMVAGREGNPAAVEKTAPEAV
jgi:hypothetical protein